MCVPGVGKHFAFPDCGRVLQKSLMCVACVPGVWEAICRPRGRKSPTEMTDVCALCIPGVGEHPAGPEGGES